MLFLRLLRHFSVITVVCWARTDAIWVFMNSRHHHRFGPDGFVSWVKVAFNALLWLNRGRLGLVWGTQVSLSQFVWESICTLSKRWLPRENWSFWIASHRISDTVSVAKHIVLVGQERDTSSSHAQKLVHIRITSCRRGSTNFSLLLGQRLVCIPSCTTSTSYSSAFSHLIFAHQVVLVCVQSICILLLLRPQIFGLFAYFRRSSCTGHTSDAYNSVCSNENRSTSNWICINILLLVCIHIFLGLSFEWRLRPCFLSAFRSTRKFELALINWKVIQMHLLHRLHVTKLILKAQLVTDHAAVIRHAYKVSDLRQLIERHGLLLWLFLVV